MSRIDCAVIQLMLVALAASLLYLFNRFGGSAEGEAARTAADAAVPEAAETGFTLFGLSVMQLGFILLFLVAVTVLIRLVIELRR